MRYDFTTSLRAPQFTRRFYEEIDERFFADARNYMPWKAIPFDVLIDFAALGKQDVLEIGVGNGSHAALLARHAKSFIGIDLTDYAVQSTRRRFELFGLPGRVLQMDAEQMSFVDASFDFVWSWGVIHHSSDTGRILREIARVLRPGGRTVTMVYHRGAWNYYMVGGFFHGLLRGHLFRTRSIHGSMQMSTDGALARFYAVREWRAFASRYLDVQNVQICGSKTDMFPIPSGKLKQTAMRLTPSALTRFLTNQCRCGSFLVSSMAKPQ
jgi:SAM-dependent methyltransferase